MAILKIRNLETSFTGKKNRLDAIRGVSFDVPERQVLGLVGESGSGKSVTMKSVLGLLPANGVVRGGEILFQDRSLLEMGEREKRNLLGSEIAMIFQDPMTSLNPLKTIGFHLEEILLRHQDLDRASARKRAKEVLEMVEIPNAEKRINQYPHEFSGGMLQRVMVGMALANEPKLLIADEPTTALDVTIQSQILALIRKLQDQNHMSVVLITHDLAVVYTICHRVVVMYGGKIMEQGLRDEIFASQDQHPYTRALLGSIPSMAEDEKKKLVPIRGVAPALDKLPEGCPFAPRCDYAMEICRVFPKEQRLSETHSVHCHLFGGDA